MKVLDLCSDWTTAVMSEREVCHSPVTDLVQTWFKPGSEPAQSSVPQSLLQTPLSLSAVVLNRRSGALWGSFRLCHRKVRKLHTHFKLSVTLIISAFL